MSTKRQTSALFVDVPRVFWRTGAAGHCFAARGPYRDMPPYRGVPPYRMGLPYFKKRG